MMENQSLIQGIIVDKDSIDEGQVIQRIAIFRGDGTPVSFSGLPFDPSLANAQYNGTVFNELAPSGNIILPNTELASGTSLLDISDPLNAKVLVAGTYAVTAVVIVTSLIAIGDALRASLHLDATGEDFVSENTASSGISSGNVLVSVSCTAYIPVEGSVYVTVINETSDNQDVRLREMAIQRIN